MPSLKYSLSDESLMFANGRTAMEVRGGAGVGSGSGLAWDVSAETSAVPGAVARTASATAGGAVDDSGSVADAGSMTPTATVVDPESASVEPASAGRVRSMPCGVTS